MIDDNENVTLSNNKRDFIVFLFSNLEKSIPYFFVENNFIEMKNDPEIIIYPLRFESEKIVLNIFCKKLKEDIKELSLNISSFEVFFNQSNDFKQTLLNGCSESIANELKKISIEEKNDSAINFIN